ncbi:MAG: hypothetical protein H6710_03625 [Myxococcales bacterium]|nr:hypothetical protein [Myxococcales bacterium]MCB9702644.1 hypothetical protein [Myxococcales bacterium]
MSVNVLHHGMCFDGAASAALFSAFFRRLSDDHNFRYIPKDHHPGDPYNSADFEADEVVGLDFRYSQNPRMTWFFDHHRSAFQLPGDREHFEADRSGHKFHDAAARSCAGYLARVVREHFDVDLSAHAELIRWAELIDSASFPDPAMPVRLEEPALRLMTFVESNTDQALVEPFIRDLLTTPMKVHAEAGYIEEALRPRLEQHARDIALLKERSVVSGDVLAFSLHDQPGRSYNKFIPYYHHPEIRYVVSLTRAQGGRLKITAGYNPWLPKPEREHNLAALLEPFGGGGHPFVAGCTFDPDDVEGALRAQRTIIARLGGAGSSR